VFERVKKGSEKLGGVQEEEEDDEEEVNGGDTKEAVVEHVELRAPTVEEARSWVSVLRSFISQNAHGNSRRWESSNSTS
jgi:hypothetical protein